MEEKRKRANRPHVEIWYMIKVASQTFEEKMDNCESLSYHSPEKQQQQQQLQMH